MQRRSVLQLLVGWLVAGLPPHDARARDGPGERWLTVWGDLTPDVW